MLLTTLTMLLAATDVHATGEGPGEDQPDWAVDYSLTSPSLIGVSLALSPSTSTGLASVGVPRPAFTNSLTLERALGAHFTGLAAVSVSASQFAPRGGVVTGGGLLGLHWYRERPLDGFWVGPELLFQVSTQREAMTGTVVSDDRALGLRVRSGWTQRFGPHFLVSASVGVGANVSEATEVTTAATLSQATANLVVDASLAAGVMF